MKKERNLKRDQLDFGNGKIGTLFRAMFFPTLVGMFFTAVLTVIDGIFVGHGVGAEGIAAVNIVAPIYMICSGIGLMLSMGASVIAGLRLSEGNDKAARIIMTQAFFVGTLLMTIICLSCSIFDKQVLSALGCSPSLEEKASDYMLWILPGLIFLLMQYIGLMLIRLDGSPKYAMWIQVVAAVLNIGLDWYMIFPLGMGVKGASIATSIACIVGGIMALDYFIFFPKKLRFYRLKLSVTSLLLTMRNTWYMLQIGFATFVTELAISITMLTGNWMFLKMLGEDGVAAFAVICYLFPVVFSISNAAAQAAQPIISYNFGAHNEQRIHTTLHLLLKTAIGIGLAICLLLSFGSDVIVSLFLDKHEAAFTYATNGLPLFSTCAAFFSVNIAFIGYYQSIKRVAAPTVFTLLRGIVLVVPCFLWLPLIIGVHGLWLAIPIAELLTSIVITRHHLWQKRHTRSKE